MESTYRDWERGRPRARSKPAAGRRGAGVTLGPRECKRLVQLGICIALFFVVFIGKGIFPEQMTAIRDQISGIISGDTDFRSVFAALGKSVTEGESVTQTLGNLWVDVFGGGEQQEAWTPTDFFLQNRGWIRKEVTAETALEGLWKEVAPKAVPVPEEDTVPPEPEPIPTTSPEPEPIAEPAVIHMDYNGPAMPENTTMDQYNLGLAETVSPLEGAAGCWVSSDYGWREHPVYGDDRFHNGVDLAVNDGTDVKCFADGTVDYIGESPIYGLYTQVSHGNGVTSFYAHCSKLLVQQGQTVQMGDVIALSGETGNATGPHLHFELKKDGVLLNPLYYVEVS